jgi:hypothetical protein
VRFVAPFVFARGTFTQRVMAADLASWPGGDGAALPVWETWDIAADDDLLPHVGKYINAPVDGRLQATVHFRQLVAEALESPHGLGGGARRPVDWRCVHGGRDDPFTLLGAGLALFESGVGFLSVDIGMPLDGTDAWGNLCHYFRFTRRAGNAGVRAVRTEGEVARPFFPDPAGGCARYRDDGLTTFSFVIEALRATVSIAGDADDWWSDVYLPHQMVPWAMVFARDVPEERIPHLLYALRHFFHSAQPVRPAPEDLRLEGNREILAYAERMWFLTNLDGGGFVACDAPMDDAFFSESLPHSLRNAYYLVFLLALHQRFALTDLSERVSATWIAGQGETLAERQAAFSVIHDALLAFTAREMSVQVMQREQYHRCYRRWQEVFQVSALYDEVTDEVREMYEELSLLLREEQRRQLAARAEADEEYERRARERESWISLIVFILGGSTIALTLVDVAENNSWPESIATLVLGALAGVVTLWLGQRLRSSR